MVAPGGPVGAEPATSGDPAATTNSAPELKLPVIAPTHTLVLGSARIPESRVNGKISGTNFLAETVRLDRTATSYVLRLAQGPPASADREILVYLKLKAGEKPGGQTNAISAEARGTTVPAIIKRWKPNPKYAAQTKTFSNGYVLKLELGAASEQGIPGRIYLALPDAEQTVIAGMFRLDMSMVTDTLQSPPAMTPATAPVGGQSAAEQDLFRKRYGVAPKQ